MELPQGIFLLCLLLASACGEITLQDNGYRDVVVAISPDIPQENGQAIINGIKSWIDAGSKKLFVATKKYAYIADVKILIPNNWTDIDDVQPSDGVIYEDAVIRVETSNPLYGDAPFTVQTGTCGARGEKTVLTENYLLYLSSLSEAYYGPPANLFAHEWAKLRYGVFDEYGYPGDTQYPLFYYKIVPGADGVSVPTLMPNFCTDIPIHGHPQDQISGLECEFEENSLTPNANCVLHLDGDNSGIRSSLMATPFLFSTDHYCETGGDAYFHTTDVRNKQKSFCDATSSWAVISSNVDFQNVQESPLDEAPPTVFTVVRNIDEGQYVMVLDTSGSMDGWKIEKLIHGVHGWIEDPRKLVDGSYLGITTFTDVAVEKAPMTEIDANSRLELVAVVDSLVAIGGTCIGGGIRQGMATLSQTSIGGVMILITDGEDQCTEDLIDPDFIQEIVDAKVRICTVAFGLQADNVLETLSRGTHGGMNTVTAGENLDDITTALDHCLSLRQSLPSSRTDFTLFSKTYTDYENDAGLPSDTFTIDKTLGSDARIRIDYKTPANIQKIQIDGPNYSKVFPFVSAANNVYNVELGALEEGVYSFTMVTTGAAISYAFVIITSKPKEGVLPFSVKCGASTGLADVDLTTTRLAIVADVMQGNMPVINATVVAIMEIEGKAPITLDLLDNGQGADTTSNDGRYSQYFTNGDNGSGRYTINCQVLGTSQTSTNGGFDSKYRYISKAYPLDPSMPPPCCGSNTVNENTVLEPTGEFYREASGGSIKIVKVPQPGDDVFPPTNIKDLSVRIIDYTIEIIFTSAGDDFDAGKASSYDIRVSENMTELFLDFESAKVLNVSLILNGFDMEPVEGGSQKKIVFDYDPSLTARHMYLGVKTYDDAGNSASVSNVVEFLLDEKPWTKLMIVSGWPSGVASDVEVINLASTTKDCQKPYDFPGAKSGSVGTHIVGQSLVCGGFTSNQCFYYEKDINSWNGGQPMGYSRYSAAAVNMNNDTWWVTGGDTLEEGISATTEIYTIENGWTPYVALPKATFNHCLLRVNNTHFMLLGGFEKGKETWIFDSKAESWSQLEDASLARRDATCGRVIKRNGDIEIVLAGGEVDGIEVDSTEVFNLRNLTWRAGEPLPQAMDLAQGVQYGTTFLAVGGFDGIQGLDTVLMYDPVDGKWIVLDQHLDMARGVYTAFLGPDDSVNC